MTRAAKGLRAVPRGVWALGFVSLFMDVSSEMIHSLLPVFLVGTLGASVSLVGVIEGVAEATASRPTRNPNFFCNSAMISTVGNWVRSILV